MRKNILLLLGLLFGIMFFLLLAIRLDVFQGKKAPPPDFFTSIKDSGSADSETWMNIFLNEQKIGYSHRLNKQTSLGYSLKDKTYLKMNIMGMVQDLFIETSGELNPDFSLSSFAFDLSSGAFRFSANGRIQDNSFYVTLGEEKIILPVNGPVYLYAGLMDAVKDMTLDPGKVITVYAFDPLTAANEPITLQFEGKENIKINAQSVAATKLNIQYKGFSQNAWIDKTGNVLKETGPMGMRLLKTTKTRALEGFNVTRMEDLTESMSVSSNMPLDRREDLVFLKLKLRGVDDIFAVDGGRQKMENSVLTITKELLQEKRGPQKDDMAEFLKPSPIIQSENEKIRKEVSQILNAEDSPESKADKILHWIYTNIEKRPVLSVPNALETLENKQGDCNEHAVLFAAMARAAGIPTQIETGLVYMKGRFYYHAWNILYLGDWITADATLGQMPADVTHIRLIRGETIDQMDLVHAIGKLNIEILESSYDRTH